MLVAVVSINVLLSGLCFYIAWKLWRIRRVLLQVENTLLSLERCSDRVLSRAPHCFSHQQGNVDKLRERYQRLEFQLQRVQQLLSLFALLGRLWRQRPWC
ncbi:MAG: hypothetical protein ACM37W_13070 [Actinomycetota bacterium]